MRIQFGANAYAHEYGGLNDLPLENFMAEAAPERPDTPFRLVPTPGLSSFSILGGAIGRGTFRSDGVISGDIIAVSGAAVYKINSAGAATPITGAVANDGLPVNFAASQTPQLVMSAGGSVYTVSASAVTAFSWTGPTGPITDVEEINQRHLYLEGGSGRVWYSAVANATSIGATDFITAESEPDQLLAIHVIGDTVILFGTDTTELWRETGDPDIPLVRRPGGAIPKGIIGRDAKTQADFGVFMVGSDSIVYRLSDFQPQRISTHPIERKISRLSAANKAKVRLSAYEQDGHSFVHLHIPGAGDYFFDNNIGAWHRRKALGDEVQGYGFGHYVAAFGNVYALTLSSGALVRVDPDATLHVAEPIRRVCSVLVPIDRAPVRISSLVIYGQVRALDGNALGSDPKGMLRVSRDGHTFGVELVRSLGKIGEWSKRLMFSPLGQATPPFVAFEFAISDPVLYFINGAELNVERI